MLIANAKVFHELLQVSETYVFLLFFFLWVVAIVLQKTHGIRSLEVSSYKAISKSCSCNGFLHLSPQRSHFWIPSVTWMILQCWWNCFVNACKLSCHQLDFQQKRNWLYILFVFPVGSMVKNLHGTQEMQGTQVLSLHRVAQSQTRMKWLSMHIYICSFMCKAAGTHKIKLHWLKKLQSSCNFQKLSMHCCMH